MRALHRMVDQIEADLIIKNATELLTLSSSFKEDSGLGITRDGAVAVRGEKILWVGESGQLSDEVSLTSGGQEFDATGKVVMPGLIDSHAHIVFGGSRENVFEHRSQCLSYLEIAERGGGIPSTVEATRKDSFEQI